MGYDLLKFVMLKQSATSLGYLSLFFRKEFYGSLIPKGHLLHKNLCIQSWRLCFSIGVSRQWSAYSSILLCIGGLGV